MVWHDCKTDPPKIYDDYLLCYLINNSIKNFTIAKYSLRSKTWWDFRGVISNPYKWVGLEKVKDDLDKFYSLSY